ncbi:MAG: class I SAM-dependent rRNA methyltransferase [Deltaproteobacteria bacterium]|nr:class I SAM-dependent rRNA methyltransferase [Deltaproteobacteria bacterium]
MVVQRGHVQPLWAGHPWVYAQAIERIEGSPAPGDVVDVFDPEGHFLGRGFYSPNSAIPVRIATRDPNDPLDMASIRRKIEEAIRLRQRVGLPSPETTGYRLVHAEGDGLPGLIVDVFGKVAVVQCLIEAMVKRREEIMALLMRLLEVQSIAEVREEGDTAKLHLLRGQELRGISFLERGLCFEIDPGWVQKTGFYFDQRENRARVESLAHGARVLDLFTYVGAFGIAAARGGATQVRSIDRSAVAAFLAARNAHINGFASRMSVERADVKRVLEELQSRKERYDLVVVDPPKLAPTVRHLEKAKVAYRRLNRQCIQVTATGGILVTCSCSAAMGLEEFLRTLSFAACDAHARLSLFAIGWQSPDHPTPPAFPEGRYLKCAFFRVLR